MTGRKPYKPTAKHIETVQKMKEKGATDKECAIAIGLGYSTFRLHKNSFFSTAIKKGNEARQQTHLETFEDNLPKQLTGYYVTEEVERVNPITGKFELAEKRKKWVSPNSTLMMFTAVNMSDGKWQSINKIEQRVNVDATPKIDIQWTKPE